MKIVISCALLLGLVPEKSLAVSPLFLKSLNKTISKVNAKRDSELHRELSEKQTAFWKKAQASLSKGEIEAVENDLRTIDLSTKEVDTKYREAFAEKAAKPLNPEEIAQTQALKEIIASVVKASSKDIETNKTLSGRIKKSVDSFPQDSQDIVPKKTMVEVEPVTEDKTQQEVLEPDYIYAEGIRGYKLPKNISNEQLLIEKAIDHQNSSYAKELAKDEHEETELFKKISKAYQRKYRTFSKRIEDAKE